MNLIPPPPKKKKDLNCLNDDNLPIPEMIGYIREKGIRVMECTSGR